MSVISDPKSRQEGNLQVNQMALLNGLVDLMFVSFSQPSVPLRPTHTPPYTVTRLKYRHLKTLLSQHLGTSQSRDSSADNADYAHFRISTA